MSLVPLPWQSSDDQMRSLPDVIVNDRAFDPRSTRHAVEPEFLTPRYSFGFWSFA
jgi:hypothetical protein